MSISVDPLHQNQANLRKRKILFPTKGSSELYCFYCGEDRKELVEEFFFHFCMRAGENIEHLLYSVAVFD